MKFLSIAVCLLVTVGQSLAFAPSSSSNVNLHSLKSQSRTSVRALPEQQKHEQRLTTFDFPQSPSDHPLQSPKNQIATAAFTALTALSLNPLSANAASTTDPNVIPSAIAAYVHYLSLFAIVSAVTYERAMIAPAMSKEVEDSVALADITLGISGTILLVSGYYRAVDYGKGWYFYSHEPIFWLKMVFLCIFGAASFFPTATIIKRAVPVATGKKDFVPMSKELADRMKQVLNAEIVMLASIPLSATLMSRGVGYTESIPFPIIGPVLCAVTIGGLGYKYINEALTWTDGSGDGDDNEDGSNAAAATMSEVEEANKVPN